jgi:hypothetical protein
MPCCLATTYAKIHHGIPPPLPLPEPSPPTSDNNEYINALEDDDIDESITEEEEEEVKPPPCSPLQAALLGYFESVHTESATRSVRIVVLE